MKSLLLFVTNFSAERNNIMPTVNEIYTYLNSLIPSSLSCEWDNDGLLCCADKSAEVSRLLITLDITDSVLEYAKNSKYDVILSHHPLIFKGVKAVNTDIGVSRRLIELISSNITAMSFHTRLDTVGGGVNDILATTLGLKNVQTFETEGLDMGRVGELPRAMNRDELALYIKEKLGAPYVNYNGPCKEIKRLAVLGGAGKDEILCAASTGADAYLTGELGHHSLTDASDFGIALFEAGHHYTEFPVCSALEKIINEKFPDIHTDIYNSIAIKTV